MACNIPRELQALRQWVCWRLVEREPGKLTKVPYTPAGRLASSTNRRTWSTFKQVCAAARGFDGIGFVFTRDAGFVGIDLDKCRDPEAGETEPWALAIIDEVSSYTELSQSGRGWHIIVRGALAEQGRCRAGRVEMYDHARFFVMTGKAEFGIGREEIRAIDLTSLQERLPTLDPFSGSSIPHERQKRPGMRTGKSESERDYRLIALIYRIARSNDPDKLEREFQRRFPERYAHRNSRKGKRGTKGYIRYSIEGFLRGRKQWQDH